MLFSRISPKRQRTMLSARLRSGSEYRHLPASAGTVSHDADDPRRSLLSQWLDAKQHRRRLFCHGPVAGTQWAMPARQLPAAQKNDWGQMLRTRGFAAGRSLRNLAAGPISGRA